ncbi:MAG: MBL fold metallo-hydrolase [Thermodesulfobacteriota bacterium]|nr:MBL fold metallo-hydrolase [Thermodesulfobacteriota bacterium]
MLVYFWGTRGSLPSFMTAEIIRKKVHKAIKESQNYKLETDRAIDEFMDNNLPFSVQGSYGCNTPCIEIRDTDEYIICDAGSGLRDFGNHIIKSEERGQKKTPHIFHIFISHLHWDHIHGFPFFSPAYVPGNHINIYGFHHELEQAFITQQYHPHFPVPIKSMQADIRFNVLELDKEHEVAGFKIKGIKQNHPGDSYGYEFVKDGKKIVYSTDAEHKKDAGSANYPFLDFFRKSDLLIFDAQYTLMDAINSKEGWGHSNNLLGVELAVKSEVKRLCLFHNEHSYDDETLEKFLNDTRKYLKIFAESYPLEIFLSYDGLKIDL